MEADWVHFIVTTKHNKNPRMELYSFVSLRRSVVFDIIKVIFSFAYRVESRVANSERARL